MMAKAQFALTWPSFMRPTLTHDDDFSHHLRKIGEENVLDKIQDSCCGTRRCARDGAAGVLLAWYWQRSGVAPDVVLSVTVCEDAKGYKEKENKFCSEAAGLRIFCSDMRSIHTI
jgi:hypothetical protein